MKKNVLLVISTLGQFPEINKIAKVLQNSNDFNPIIYFNQGVRDDNKYLEVFLKNQIDVLGGDLSIIKLQDSNMVAGMPPIKTTMVVLGKKKLINIKPRTYIKKNFPALFEFIKNQYYSFQNFLALPDFFFRIVRKLKRNKIEKELLLKHKISLVVLAEDSEDYSTPQLVALAHKLNIKTVVFPYTFANQYEFLEDAYFHDRRVNCGIFSYLAGALYPKWTANYKGKKLIKSTPSLIFTCELFGKSPPNPWVMSSGFSDMIAVESEFMKEYYAKAGIPRKQMLETGYPSTDDLYNIVNKREFSRRVIAAKLNLNDEKPWVLCAVPPSQWPRAGVGFESYDEFLNSFFKYLKDHNDVEVLFKFHPRDGKEAIKNLCEKYEIKFIEEDTTDLIGVCDMYIASVSSTIRWALAIGLPTINYDLYNYNYGDFDGAVDYYTVIEFDNFKKIFERMEKNKFLKNDLVLRAQKKFAVLDGRASERIINLFNNMVNNGGGIK